jgi:hypothetical protein
MRWPIAWAISKLGASVQQEGQRYLKVLPPMVMGAGRMMNRKAQAKANAARTMREYGLRAKHTMVIADSTMK